MSTSRSSPRALVSRSRGLDSLGSGAYRRRTVGAVGWFCLNWLVSFARSRSWRCIRSLLFCSIVRGPVSIRFAFENFLYFPCSR